MQLRDEQEYERERVRRYQELAERARRMYGYVYSDFHSANGAALAYRAASAREVRLFGGMEDAERQMVRFGDPGELGYEEPFPIDIVLIEPKQKKFSEALTHRDYLGALMSLGIEREMLGDLLVKDGTACVFVCERMTALILNELKTVRHTAVKAAKLDAVPPDMRPKLQRETVTVSSLRLDGILARAFHLSRGDAKKLFEAERVFLNGRLCKSPEKEPAEGDRISLRGFGKMQYFGVRRVTAKDRLAVEIGRFV